MWSIFTNFTFLHRLSIKYQDKSLMLICQKNTFSLYFKNQSITHRPTDRVNKILGAYCFKDSKKKISAVYLAAE